MNTPSDAMAESPSTRRNRARGHVGDSALLLVGAARIVGEPLDLHRAAGRRRGRAVRLPDRHDPPAAQNARHVGARPGAAGRQARPAIRLRRDGDHPDRVHRRGVLLPGRAAQRTPRSQHPVLEVAAGFGSHDRALEGEHSARGSAADRLRDHRCHAADHAAAGHRGPAGERPERRAAVDRCPCSRCRWCCSTV